MNLKQLSDVLGLSPTTVSRALNGYPEVNAKTRSRVLDAARRHGYVPNSMARRLATGRAYAIGHIVPLGVHDMINPIFADFIAGAGETYAHRGYKMMISVAEPEEEEARYRALAADQSVDGVIVHGPGGNDPRIQLLNRLGLPFLVHGRCETDWPYSWLDVNNTRAFEMATEHLIGLGHKRIALLNGLGHMDFAARRRTGYETALRAHGLPINPDMIFHADMTEPYGYQVAKALLASSPPPTAILVSSFITAIGVSRAIAEAGLEMGRDVSVVTHDDETAFLPNHGDTPMFTATTSSVRQAGKRCAELLIGMVEGTITENVHELWEVEMTEGASTGPCLG